MGRTVCIFLLRVLSRPETTRLMFYMLLMTLDVWHNSTLVNRGFQQRSVVLWLWSRWLAPWPAQPLLPLLFSINRAPQFKLRPLRKHRPRLPRSKFAYDERSTQTCEYSADEQMCPYVSVLSGCSWSNVFLESSNGSQPVSCTSFVSRGLMRTHV